MAAVLNLGIIGVGNLGGALAEGALAAGAASRILAADLDTARLEELAGRIGDRFQPMDVGAVASGSGLIVVAVKPHVVPSVLRDVDRSLRPGCPLVSVAAGVTLRTIQASLRPGLPVVRAMPNLAMLVRESATALTANDAVSPAQMRTVQSVFEAVGKVYQVSESQMHAVTGLSGSGPAYVGLVVEGLAAGAVQKGLPPKLAMAMACQLLQGSARLLSETGWHPAALKDRVTTPAGTTIAGLKELEIGAVRGALLSAVEAASERSEELAGR